MNRRGLATALLAPGIRHRAAILGLLLVLNGSAVSATPMSPADRQGFITAASQSCFQGQRKSFANRGVSDAQLTQYCSCISVRAAELVTSEDLREYTATKDNSVLAGKRKAAADYCNVATMKEPAPDTSKAVEAAPVSIESKESFKQQYVQGYLGNCRNGQLSESEHDPIVDKLVSKTNQRKLCACQANKSFELIGFDKLKTSISNKDPSLIKPELQEAISYCMKELKEKDQISLAIATACMTNSKQPEGGYSPKQVESFCVCQGKRVGQKSNSWKNLESMLGEKDVLKESKNYCARSGVKLNGAE